jgi:hypothetical protein
VTRWAEEIRRQLDAERARRAALFPSDASCESCGCMDPIVLIPDDRMILCGDCDAVRRERRPVHRHHVAGHHRGPWLIVSVNTHRRLTTREVIRRRLLESRRGRAA